MVSSPLAAQRARIYARPDMSHRHLGAGIAAVVALLAALVPTAAAETRLAAPDGAGADPQCVASPCTLGGALEVAGPGDVVVAAPGVYELGDGGISVGNDVTLRGTHGAAAPTLRSGSLTPTLDVNPGSTVSRIRVVNTALQGIAASLRTGALMRDSTAWASGDGGTAVEALGSPGPQLINVTAAATGAGGRGLLADNGGDALTGTNVIAEGSPDLDVAAGSSTFFLSSSNFDAPGEAVVVEGTGNQTAEPLLAAPVNGDFRQLTGSPTIDAGSLDAPLGTADPDADVRIQGAGPDIGADEFAVPGAPPPGGGPAPGDPQPGPPSDPGTPGPGAGPGTLLSGPRILGTSVDGPVIVGRRALLIIEASDPTAPISGASVGFGGRSFVGGVACRLGAPIDVFLPARTTRIGVPFRVTRAGRHVFRIGVSSGRCYSRGRTATTTLTIDAVTAAPRARAAQASCAGANLLPARRNLRKVVAATLCLLNRERAANGLRPLRRNRRLARAARTHNRLMLRSRTFAHQVPGEAVLPRRLERVGYRWGAGENLGAGALQPYASPAGQVDGWMNSPPHRANILDRRFRAIGIAVAASKPAPAPPTPGASYTTVFGTRR